MQRPDLWDESRTFFEKLWLQSFNSAEVRLKRILWIQCFYDFIFCCVTLKSPGSNGGTRFALTPQISSTMLSFLFTSLQSVVMVTPDVCLPLLFLSSNDRFLFSQTQGWSQLKPLIVTEHRRPQSPTSLSRPSHLAPRWWLIFWLGCPRCYWPRSCTPPPRLSWWLAVWACPPSPGSAVAGCRWCWPRWAPGSAPHLSWCTPATPSGQDSPQWDPPPAVWWTGRLRRKRRRLTQPRHGALTKFTR